MSNVVVIYESKYGQSEKIAEHIAELARGRGHRAQTLRTEAAKAIDLNGQAAVFVVAPIYLSRHPKAIERFVASRHSDLSAMPSAFLSVSGSAADPDPVARAALEQIDRAFLARTGWRPRRIAWIGGAMSWPRYGFFVGLVMKAIARRKGAVHIDETRVDELTDWAAVDAVAHEVLDAIRPPIAKAPPEPALDRSAPCH